MERLAKKLKQDVGCQQHYEAEIVAGVVAPLPYTKESVVDATAVGGELRPATWGVDDHGGGVCTMRSLREIYMSCDGVRSGVRRVRGCSMRRDCGAAADDRRRAEADPH